MSEIHVKDGESIDSALKRFKRSCAKAGVIAEVRKREHYESPSVKRRKKSEAARKNKKRYYCSVKEKCGAERDSTFYVRRPGNSLGSRSCTSGYIRKAAAKPMFPPVRSFWERVSASSKRTKCVSPSRA